MGTDEKGWFEYRPPTVTWFIGTALLLLIFWSAVSTPQDAGGRQAEFCREGSPVANGFARAAAQRAVRDRLEYGGSARFPGPGAVRHREGCLFEAAGQVDAANGFGAMRRLGWTATVEYDPKSDSWTAVEARLEGR